MNEAKPRRKAPVVLVAVGVLAAVGLAFIAHATQSEDIQIAAALTAVGVFPLLVVLFMALVVRILRKIRFSGIATACLAVAGLTASLAGAWLLVALACKAGGVR